MSNNSDRASLQLQEYASAKKVYQQIIDFLNP